MSAIALKQVRAALLGPLGAVILVGLAVSIGQIFGIPVTVSPLIIVMIVLFTLGARRYVLREVDWYPAKVYWVCGVAGAIAVVLSVLGHELSHAIVSQGVGIPITEMHFSWWGAYVSSAKPFSEVSPWVEFLVCAAGPLFNLAVAGILVIPVWIFGESAAENTVQYVCSINVSLGVINLLPIHPLDGGKILHAILWGVLGNPDSANTVVDLITLFIFVVVIVTIGLRIAEKITE